MICEPKIFLHSIDESCTDLRKKIFQYFFPLIKLPEQYQEVYDKSEDKEKAINKIYESFYNKTDHGEKKIFTFEFEKEKSMYQSMIKFAPFEESDQNLGDFLDSIEHSKDFIMRIYFQKSSKIDFYPLEGGHKSSGESGNISIDDCLERFRIDELLKDDNKYYCGKCKEHQETFKKMDIYRLPRILVIQLKRFNKGDSSSKYGYGRIISGSSKNTDLIEFPIEGLDMGKYLLNKEEGKEYMYDLYAVSNHMGSLYGGHYTAHCKNSINDKWYYFNDSSCGSTSKESIVCSSAYVLFYRLRE